MKIVLLLIALVGYVFSTTSINCVNGNCVSCDENGCRETRTVEAETKLIRCTCQGTYCRECYSYRCITVKKCDSKQKREASENLFVTCACSRTNSKDCQYCDMFGCRNVASCRNEKRSIENFRSAEQETVPVTPAVPDFPYGTEEPNFPRGTQEPDYTKNQ